MLTWFFSLIHDISGKALGKGAGEVFRSGTYMDGRAAMQRGGYPYAKGLDVIRFP